MLTVPKEFAGALGNSLKELIIKIGPRDEKNEEHWLVSSKPELAYNSDILYKVWVISGIINKHQTLNKYVNQAVLHSVIFDAVKDNITSIVSANDSRITVDAWKEVIFTDEERNKLVESVVTTISDDKEWNVHVPLYDVTIESDFTFGNVRFTKCSEEKAHELTYKPTYEGMLGALGSTLAGIRSGAASALRLQDSTLLEFRVKGIHYNTSHSLVVEEAEKIIIVSLALIYICIILNNVSSKTKYWRDYSSTLNLFLKSDGSEARDVVIDRISPFTDTYSVSKAFSESKNYPFILCEDFINKVPSCYLKERIYSSIDWFYDYLWERNYSMRFIKLFIACEILLEVEPGQNQKVKFTDNAVILAGRDLEQRKQLAKEVKNILEKRGAIFHRGERKTTKEDSEALVNLFKLYLRILTELMQISITKAEYREKDGYKDFFTSQKYGAWHPNRPFELPKVLQSVPDKPKN